VTLCIWVVRRAAGLTGGVGGGQSQAYTITGSVFCAEEKVHAFAVFGVVQHLGLTFAWAGVSLWQPDSAHVFITYWIISAVLAAVTVVGVRAIGGAQPEMQAPLLK
jgi:hypothetical protein